MIPKERNIGGFTNCTATGDTENQANVEDILDIPDLLDIEDEVFCIDLSFMNVQPLRTVFPNTNTFGTDVWGGGNMSLKGNPMTLNLINTILH